jgi:hypothetical protein
MVIFIKILEQKEEMDQKLTQISTIQNITGIPKFIRSTYEIIDVR